MLKRAFVLSGILLFLLSISNSAATWRTSGNSMTAARKWFTSTLLPNGKILFTGGSDGSSAELYDPTTGTFTATGPMSSSRSSHTATLLPNGEVLITGGNNGSGNSNYLSSAELYDPASGTFTPTGHMGSKRLGHTATLLPNGKVLIAGGAYSFMGLPHYLASAEVYDPSGGTFAPTTYPMNNSRASHSATLLPNGRVLIAGGYHSGSDLASAEVYDPDSQTFTPTGSMSNARQDHTATLLPNGTVLITGGTWLTYLSSAEVYDPSSGTFVPTGEMTARRSYHTASLLPNGKVLIAGGHDGSEVLSSTELFDPSSGTFSSAGDLTNAREFQTATLLPDGKVLIAGGDSAPTPLSSVEFYDPSSGTFTNTGYMNGERDDFTATLLPSGKVLIAGGYDQPSGLPSTYLSEAELFDPSGGTFTTITTPMLSKRGEHTATLLANGKVLLAGGNNGGGPSAELYNPSLDTFEATGEMKQSRYWHSATLLPSGKVLIAGGVPGGGGGTNTAELYDPNGNGGKGTFDFTGSMKNGREEHTATLLMNGKVLVAGGNPGGTYLSEAELYDPSVGSFSDTAPMNNARISHTATLLPNGKVLIAGGYDSGVISNAELFDPSGNGGAGSFTLIGSMNDPRKMHTATLLPSGKVLIIGGARQNWSFPSSTELYDPSTGSFEVSSSINDVRMSHTATLLPNGKILIAGGRGPGPSWSMLSSAELARYTEYDYTSFESMQPVIQSYTAQISPGGTYTITGTGFRGTSEASGGNNSVNSPTNYPRVYLQKMDTVNQEGASEGGMLIDCTTTEYPISDWSNADTLISFTTPSDLSAGHYILTVVANAVPSDGKIVYYEPPYVPPTLPATPEGLVTTNITTNSADGTWEAVSGIATYEVSWGTDEAATNGGEVPTTEASYSWTGLSPSTTYYWMVAAVNGVGTGEYSGISSFETLSLTLPATPEGLVTINITANSAYGTWEAVSGAASYLISWGMDTDATNEGEITTTEASYSWTTLSPSTEYYWMVAAVSGVGTGEYSDIVSFETQAGGYVSGPDMVWVKLNGKTLRPNIFNYTSASPEVEMYVTAESGIATLDANVSTGSLGIYQTIYFTLTNGTTFEGTWRGTEPLAIRSKGDYVMSCRGTDSNGKTYGMPPFSAPEAYQLRIGGGTVQMVGGIYNYPNPFRPSSGGTTQIQYTLTSNATVFLIIYDISGREVKRMKFASGGTGGSAGVNFVPWDGRSLGGQLVGSGMYVYKIISGNRVLGDGRIVVAK